MKGIDLIQVSAPEGQIKTLLTSVSSDGFVHLYDTDMLDSLPTPLKDVLPIEPIARYDTKGTRLTCVAFAGRALPLSTTESAKGTKRPLEESGDEDSGDEDSSDEETS